MPATAEQTSPTGTSILPAGYPDENVYVPWVPHTAHKHLALATRSGDPPPSPRQSPEKNVYVHVPFPFLT